MKKIKIVLLGSGNMATRLGIALFRGGEAEFIQVYSPNISHARKLAERLGNCEAADVTEDIRATDADLILSAVKDSAAKELWKRIAFEGKTVLHTAGSLSMEDLAPFTRERGVIYPLQTLSKAREVDFSKIPILIEANSFENLRTVRRLAESLGGPVRETDSETRKIVHLAAVFANNFSNHMFELAGELLEEHGLEFELLRPIIDETAAKLYKMRPAEAQTGPAVRYDENVMKKHLNMLKNHPEMQNIYQTVSKGIHETCIRKKT